METVSLFFDQFDDFPVRELQDLLIAPQDVFAVESASSSDILCFHPFNDRGRASVVSVIDQNIR